LYKQLGNLMHFAVPHLSRIGQSYYLRITVPKDLRQSVGWREIKRSLHTSNTQQAVREAQQLSDPILELFGLLRGMSDMVDPQKVQQLIDKVVQDRSKANLHWCEQHHIERGPVLADQVAMELQDAEEHIERLKGELQRGDYKNQPNIASFVKAHYSKEEAELIDDPHISGYVGHSGVIL
jgi:hypothetical protein